MTAKEILQRIRQTFDELQKHGAETPQKQDEKQNVKMSKKLADGTEIEVTDMAVGGIVTIAGSPAPSGEHKLEDGTIIVIGENGAITEIKPAVSEEPTGQEDMGKKTEVNMAEEFSKFQNSTSQKFTDYEAKFASYETKFASYEEKLTKYAKVIDGLLNLTQTLADTPTGVPDTAVKGAGIFSEDKTEAYEILFTK